ncbi:uncharacterized protein BP5553_01614 [Venustampulla echinocandica]|uniref:Uncharacterized protein n=1 Tax=Venustampulla echinocandica TaxID=2656787 RepID=A0A370U1J2_9HELO|nr:uncharacterized protein BP5553_01614 [Venustampulla echinocandica]RDL41635.1 hypothetical protein BP5553_01614 [Venustampulla echinocandica]
MQRLQHILFGLPPPPPPATNDKSSVSGSSPGNYQPSISDVLQVKETLLEKLPLELIDVVIDAAEYWPHTTSINTPPAESPFCIRGDANHENQFILRTPPLGFVPVSDWRNTTADTDTITDVGPELEGTGRLSWSLDTSPKLAQSSDIPQAKGSLTDEVLKGWEATSNPREKFPCRKIVFTIRSRDQGWGGSSADRGSYRGSFTWFDVGLERMIAYREGTTADDKEYDSTPSSTCESPIVCSTYTVLPAAAPAPNPDDPPNASDHPLLPGPMCIQKNVTADQTAKEHRIVWSVDDNINPESPEADELENRGRGRATATGEFVRNLKLGDSVTVWQKARFHGWANFLEYLKVEVYWAV